MWRANIPLDSLVQNLLSGRLECAGVLHGRVGLDGLCIRIDNLAELKVERAGGKEAVELRLRVVAAAGSGLTHRALAVRFGVPFVTISRWFRAAGKRCVYIEEFEGATLAAIRVDQDVSMKRLADMLAADHAAPFSTTTVWRFLKRRGIRLRKPGRNGGFQPETH